MLFSVVTINRNNASGLERTIKSVISQPKDLYEYIIIDGASNDGSIQIAEKYASYIDVFISEPDSGVYNAMNKSLKFLKGDYVIFMNSGDEFASDKILRQVVDMNLKEDFIFGGFIRTRNGNVVSKSMPESDISLYSLLYTIVICHQSTFTKVSLFKDSGGYDETIKLSADWAFLFDSLVLKNKSYSVIQLYVCRYDITGMSADVDSAKNIREEKLYHLRKCLPYAYSDYLKMHSFLRFSPQNILRYIKWKFSLFFYK